MSSMFYGHGDQGECIAFCTRFLSLLFKEALLQHHQPSPNPLKNNFLHCTVQKTKGKEPILGTISPSLPARPVSSPDSAEPLALNNKAPRWHEQLQCWCLNFKGRVTVASVKNFQLVAAGEPSHDVSPEEQEKVILQFGKFGKDIFTMDYRYPLSAFQAFAISLSCFDTKPAFLEVKGELCKRGKGNRKSKTIHVSPPNTPSQRNPISTLTRIVQNCLHEW
ncbi:hypothetical protein GQ457_05G006500 [Hibiscus cannabinus]